MKRVIAMLAVLAMALGLAGAAEATLTPSLALSNFTNVGDAVAGEGAAPNTCIGGGGACPDPPPPPTAVQHLDWIVKRVADDNPETDFLYMYQLENRSVASLSAAIVVSGLFDPTSVQIFNDKDLDVVADVNDVLVAFGLDEQDHSHDVAFFGNLATEHDGDLTLGGTILTVIVGATQTFIAFNVDLNVGEQSGVVAALGSRPIYVPWNTSGDQFTWNSNHPNPEGEAGRRVAAPGPVPEPSTLLLLGAGLVGMGLIARRGGRRS